MGRKYVSEEVKFEIGCLSENVFEYIVCFLFHFCIELCNKSHFQYFVRTVSHSKSDGEISLQDARQWTRLYMNKLPVVPPCFPFLKQPGITINITDISDPFLFFELFFDEQLMLQIEMEKNCHTEQYITQNVAEEKSRMKVRKETNLEEMYVFLGLLILQDVTAKSDIELYWSKNKLLETPMFGKFISRNHFQVILRSLHFSNNTTFDENSHLNECKNKKNLACFSKFYEEIFKRSYTQKRSHH